MTRKSNIEEMLVLANRLNEIVEEMKARAKIMFPEVYNKLC